MNRLLCLACSVALGAMPALAVDTDRHLSLSMAPGARFSIDAGAGFLKIEGREGQQTIEVKARIVADNLEEKDLSEYVVLTLEKTSDGARLKADIKHGGRRSWFGLSGSGRIDLTVTVPKAMKLSVMDGSGALEIRHIQGDVDIEDGSGEMTVEDITGNLSIEDGSGGIFVKGVTGDVTVDDGSGGMEIRQVGGSVTVHDGSGSIDIDGVGKDVRFKGTGSGGVSTNNVKGRVYR